MTHRGGSRASCHAPAVGYTIVLACQWKSIVYSAEVKSLRRGWMIRSVSEAKIRTAATLVSRLDRSKRLRTGMTSGVRYRAIGREYH